MLNMRQNLPFKALPFDLLPMREQFLFAENAQTRGHAVNVSFMRLMPKCP